MYRYWQVLLLFIGQCCWQPVAFAQSNLLFDNAITLKFFGLSMHLKESPYPEIFPNRIDKKGYFVFNYGGIVGYERNVFRHKFSLRIEQGLYADCAGSLAGFTHVGWRSVIFNRNRHSLNGGIGPTLVYRRDWNGIKGYEDNGYFNRKGDWQYKYYWYGAELEYNYQLKESLDLSINLVPGFPELVSIGVGVRKHF